MRRKVGELRDLTDDEFEVLNDADYNLGEVLDGSIAFYTRDNFRETAEELRKAADVLTWIAEEKRQAFQIKRRSTSHGTRPKPGTSPKIRRRRGS